MTKNRINYLPSDFFNENTRKFEALASGDYFDPLFGVDTFEITEEDIKALRHGMILYGNNDEYAMLIQLAERREE